MSRANLRHVAVTTEAKIEGSFPQKITRRTFLESTVQTSTALLAGDLFLGAKILNGADTDQFGKPITGNRDIPTVKAIQHIRRMRGGAQSHLMRCSDKNFYVVKFQNNPQHLKVLANEILATELSHLAGLPVPLVAIVDVEERLIKNTSELKIELQTLSIPCSPGLQFGARFAGNPWNPQVFDHLPVSLLERVTNKECFAGILALDKWTCNSDYRQAIFLRGARDKKYSTTFIDQGYCFNAGEWTFPDDILRGVFPANEVYSAIVGWSSFEPWLSKIEGMSEESIWWAAGSVPPEWYRSDWGALEKLVQALLQRRTRVRGLITEFRTSVRHPFPKWAS